MVAGNPAKKTGGGYNQEDLSVFYYCERDYKNGTVVGYSTYDLPKFGCSFLTTKVWCKRSARSKYQYRMKD